MYYRLVFGDLYSRGGLTPTFYFWGVIHLQSRYEMGYDSVDLHVNPLISSSVVDLCGGYLR